MKVASILGSPRKKGTSARIAQAFTDFMTEKGAEVVEYYLNGMSYKGCQGCEVCHSKQDCCVLKDDLTPALDSMREVDVLVLSTPVYYGDISGQFKMLIDRTWSHVDVDYNKADPYSSRIPEGKTAILILTQGETEDRHRDVIERYSVYLNLYGFDLKVVRATSLASGMPDGDVSAAQAEVVSIANELIADR
ncbi:flavodoxin family protein [Maridesulfovibrio sp.]|uniref:flavodoxin family protein n=1 Tax=Maridesulfovibrio sp. TaxID=2795000 RepID=UPI0039F12BD7